MTDRLTRRGLLSGLGAATAARAFGMPYASAGPCGAPA
jgi:hypothetical protein